MSSLKTDQATSGKSTTNDNSEGTASTDKAISAIMASAVIVGGFVVYWMSEIEAVREMLKLAYG